MKLRVGQKRLLLTSTSIMFQELARHSQSDWPRYARIVRFLRDLIGERILLDTPLLIAQEFRNGGVLTDRQSLRDRRAVAIHWSAVSHRGFLAQVIPGARAQAEDYAKQHEDFRRLVTPQLAKVRPTLTLHESVKRWWSKDGRSFTRNVAADALPQMAADMAECSYPKNFRVEVFPAYWYSFSYRFARIVLDVTENRKIKPSDYADPSHYAAGAYCDLLVTDDGPMYAAHQLQPWSAIRPVKLSDFIRDYLDG